MKDRLLTRATGTFVRWTFSGFNGSYGEAEARHGRSTLTFLIGLLGQAEVLFLVLLLIGDR